LTKKSIALSMALTLLGGLFATAMTTTAGAATPKSHETEFSQFKYADGKFVGRVAGKRYLCLQNHKVVIVKQGATTNVAVASLNVSPNTWQSFGEGKFAVKHPALEIDNARKRRRALKGTYFAKYVEAPVNTYGKTGLCLGSKSDTLEI
jgi:hypothetical protein